MKAARTDSTQAAIIATLRAVGCVVWEAAGTNGGPDLVVLKPSEAVRLGVGLYLLECKSEKGKLNPLQEKFHAEWRGQVSIVRSVEEALRVVGIRV